MSPGRGDLSARQEQVNALRTARHADAPLQGHQVRPPDDGPFAL